MGARHQRCWAHKILEEVRQRDYEEMNAGAQAVCSEGSQLRVQAASRASRARILPLGAAAGARRELLSFFTFPGIRGVNCAPAT
jgi:hypothetical protein